MKNTHGRYSWAQRLGAFALAMLMVVGILPARILAAEEGRIAGQVTTVADPDTVSRPANVYGTNTQNAGKITVGKSVSDAAVTLPSGTGSQTFTPQEDQFIVTVSQAAQVMGLTSESKVPVDVVFVLDTSGSMKGGRSTSMVAAANSAIKTLMEANDYNRVGVVAFSSNSYWEAAAEQLSALAHYDDVDANNDGDLNDRNDVDAASNHLRWSDDYIVGRGNNAGSRDGVNGGTNIHAGIALGAQMLTGASTTVEIDGKTVTRMPFLVILSDGAPTYSSSSTNWYNPSMTNQQGDGNNPYAGNGFLAAMTAAYYKGKVTEHYYPDNASEDNRCCIYTIGVGLSELTGNEGALAQMTMDPKEYFKTGSTNTYYNGNGNHDFYSYWNNYVSNPANGFTVQVNSGSTFRITQASVNATKNYVGGLNANGVKMYNGGVAYNDDYFSADETADIAAAFDKAIMEIQQKAISSPTLVDKTFGEDFSGYVTFTDPIGEYMEVKQMYGVLANGNWYRGKTFAQYLDDWDNAPEDFKTLFTKVLQERCKLSGTTVDVEDFVSKASASENQAYYNSDTDYDNSIVWWGNAYTATGEEDEQVQYLGFADNDTIEYITDENTVIPADADYVCRSYYYYGTAGNTVENPNHEYLHFVVRVQRALKAPYQETVVISAPASLLSVEQVLITEKTDNAGNKTYTAAVKEAEPARVVYEVGLRSDINVYNVEQVLAEDPAYLGEQAEFDGEMVYTNHDAAEGSYTFYTNDWNRAEAEDSHHRAMAKATFDAAADNAFYAYQEDTLIYAKNGENYVPYTGSKPVGDGYYYARTVYDWSGESKNEDGTYDATAKTVYIPVSLPNSDVVKQADGQWYIAKGAYKASSLTGGEDVEKTANNTQTSTVVVHPHRTEDEGNSHYTVVLGNNGKLTLKAEDTKSVDIQKADQTVITDADGKVVMVGDTLTYHIQVINGEDSMADAVVTDTIPVGTAYVEGSASHDGVYDAETGIITWNLTGLAAGETVEISFQVTVTEAALTGEQGVSSIENTANVKLSNGFTYDTNTTHNPPEGKKVVDTNGNLIEGNVQVPDVLVYRIRYYNDTDSVATVTITDVIPAGTSYVANSASHNGVYDAENKNLVWTIKDVQPGAGDVVSFRVNVNASAVEYVENDATIKIGNNDPRQTNKTVVEVDTGDLILSKDVVAEGYPNAMDQVFTLTITEIGLGMNGTYPMTRNGETVEGGVAFQNGAATVTIRHGDVLRISDIPAGAILTVAETAKNGFTPGYYVNGAAVAVATEGRVTIVEGENPVSVRVENTYSPAATTFQLKGTKTLETTAALADTVFGFTVSACDEKGVVLTGNAASMLTGEVTVSAAAKEAAITFAPATFTEPGTYYYLINEINGGLTGIDYAENQYLLAVTVTDDGTGVLKASATLQQRENANGEFGAAGAYTDTGVVFVNTYAPLETQIVLTAEKELTGRNLKDGEFSFVVKQGDTVVSTATNAADGSISFRPITYTAAGTYTYTISEVNGGLKGVEYDTASYTVTVNVVDDGGKLVATPVYPNGGVAFENKFTPDGITVELSANKTLVNRSGDADRKLREGEFRFVVKDADGKVVASGTNAADGSIAFAPIGYTVADAGKTYTYSVSEVIPDLSADPYMDYDETVFTVTVAVSYDANAGELSTKVTYPDSGVKFTNTQYPDVISVTPVGSKTTTVKSGSQAQIPKDATFSFTVINVDTGSEAGAGVGSANGDIRLSTLSFSQPGTYRYWIKETHAGQEVHGITYDGSVYLMEVVVTLENGKLEATTAYYRLKDGGNADNAADYTEKLTGAPTFNNTYDAKGQITITAKKVLENKKLNAGDFAFRLTRVDTGKGVTGVVAADGTITFATIYFDLHELGEGGSKTIHYKMSEIVPEAAKLPGVTYDTKEYDVYVTITHTDDGAITAAVTDANGTPLSDSSTDSGVTFTNTYAPQEGTSITFEGTKKLTGRELKAGEFSFELYHVDATGKENLVDTATNDASGSFRFTRVYPATILGSADSAEFDYVIREINNHLGGVSYDSAEFGVTVTITDNKDGTLRAVAAYDQTVEFTNTYDADGTKFIPTAKKILNNRVLKDNEFSFVVKQGDAVVSTGWSKADGTVAFSPVGLETPGVYTYTVSEIEGNLTGVTYTDVTYYLQVTVVDNQDGTMTATGKYFSDAACKNGVQEAVFTNTYTPQNASIQLTASKILTGRDMTQGEFSFVVKQGDTVVAAGGNAAAGDGESGAVVFSNIGYQLSDLAGADSKSFVYTISEQATAQGGVTVDTTVYYAKVTLTNNVQTGVLETAVKYYSDAACTEEVTEPTFNNTYATTPAKLKLTAGKTLINKTIEAGEFTFTLRDNDGVMQTLTAVNDAAGNVSFDELVFRAPGTYVFTVSESVTDSTEADRYTMDNDVTVVVTVTDNLKGQLVATVTYHETAADGSYNNQQNLGGVAFINRYTAPELVLPLDAQIGATKTVNTPDGITYSPAGFRFAVTDSTGAIIKGWDAEGNEVDMIGISDESGKIIFPEFIFTHAGQYYYRISEMDSGKGGITEDSRTWEVHILVRYNETTGLLYVNDSDVHAHLVGGNADAEVKPAFVNTYEMAPAVLNLVATKVLEGRDLKDREFLFYLMEGDRIAAQAYNSADGKIRFTLNYTKPGTHTYTLREDIPETGLGGVSYDNTVYSVVTVEVRDNGEGQLVAYIGGKAMDNNGTAVTSVTVTNTYTAKETSAQIIAHKTLLGGKPLAPEAYTFELKNTADGETIASTNDAAGNVEYVINYTETGTYTYELTEQKGSDPGITYDETVHTVIVEVTDDGKGQLHAEVKYTDGEIPAFINQYKAEPGTAVIEAGKVLEGKELVADAYTFVLINQADESDTYTAKNDADGKISFTVSYEEVGVYTYTLSEQAGTENKVIYDDSTYTVTVTVTDDLEGLLHADVVYETENGTAPTFRNVYKPDPATVKLSASKILTGRKLKANEFTFQVLDREGNVLATARNGEDGTITFPEIRLETAGTYTFTVIELRGAERTMVYDTTRHTVTVNVVDEEGILKATVTYPEGGITFKNAYKAPDPTSPSTADESVVMPMTMAMLFSGSLLALLVDSRKRRGSKR